VQVKVGKTSHAIFINFYKLPGFGEAVTSRRPLLAEEAHGPFIPLRMHDESTSRQRISRKLPKKGKRKES